MLMAMVIEVISWLIIQTTNYYVNFFVLDLVVSAVGNTSGQAVFVLRSKIVKLDIKTIRLNDFSPLRSFPVANVVLTITQAPAEINRLVKACVVNGAPITW